MDTKNKLQNLEKYLKELKSESKKVKLEINKIKYAHVTDNLLTEFCSSEEYPSVMIVSANSYNGQNILEKKNELESKGIIIISSDVFVIQTWEHIDDYDDDWTSVDYDDCDGCPGDPDGHKLFHGLYIHGLPVPRAIKIIEHTNQPKNIENLILNKWMQQEGLERAHIYDTNIIVLIKDKPIKC